MKLKTHNIKYNSSVSKQPNSFEKINWQKTLKIYYFYNQILNSRKLIILNILFLNKFLREYFFNYTKHRLRHFNSFEHNLSKKKIFGYFSKYSQEHIKHIFFKKEVNIFYEFGSGASTVLIAQELYEQHKSKKIKGKLYTFDQSKIWLDQLKKNFPTHLLKYVKFQVSTLEYTEKKNIRFLRYANINYHNNIDAVYIDGPSVALIKNFIKTKTAVNGNLYDLLKMKIAKYIFTDKRFYHFYALNKYTKNYDVNIHQYFRSIQYFLKK